MSTETVLFAAQQILGESGHSAIANSLRAVIGEIKERDAAVAELMEACRPIANIARDSSLRAEVLKGMRPHEAAALDAAVARVEASLARCKQAVQARWSER